MSNTDFDAIATEYAATKQLPLHEHVELHSFFKLTPNLKDKKVLDLGCGEGALTRKLVENGASNVVGVDISEEMIALAREKEAANPQGIKYVHQDVTALGKVDGGTFDIVTAGYLLNAADSPEMLMTFCESIFSNLTTDGIFIALNFNFCIPVELYGTYRKYNIYVSTDVPLKEGMPITITFKNNDAILISVEDYYLAL